MDETSLAERIFARPDAYLSRTSSRAMAERWAAESRKSRVTIFHGPTSGQYWVAPRGAVSRALRTAGLEVAPC